MVRLHSQQGDLKALGKQGAVQQVDCFLSLKIMNHDDFDCVLVHLPGRLTFHPYDGALFDDGIDAGAGLLKVLLLLLGDFDENQPPDDPLFDDDPRDEYPPPPPRDENPPRPPFASL